MKYFSYDPTVGGYGFETHDTAKEARARAEQVLADFLNTGWDDVPDNLVEDICWGELKGEVKNVMVEPNEDGVMMYELKLEKVK